MEDLGTRVGVGLNNNGQIMGVDQREGDSAADVTYSTKPDGPAFGGMATSKIISPFGPKAN